MLQIQRRDSAKEKLTKFQSSSLPGKCDIKKVL